MQHQTLSYRPEIDGLRAIAILLVVLFHAGISPFKGGFLGVDIFFVISGYLITSIIHTEMQQGRFSFRRFYLRRMRRLFPALFAMCIVITVAALLLFTPDYLADYGLSLASAILYVSNFFLWKESADYFGNATEFWPLLHTWSLAIEEQYYIFWPLLLWALLRWTPRVFALLIVAALCAGSFAAYHMLAAASESLAAFYLLPTRAWELMVGSALALGIFPAVHNRMVSQLLGITGLAMIVGVTVWFYLAMPPQTVGMALVTIGTVLILYSSATVKTYVSAFLSYRLLVSIGLVSYSLYLWHWPILSLAHYYAIWTLKWYEAMFAVQASVVMAALSWQYIEQPFRLRRDGFFGDRNLIILTITMSLLLAGTGMYIWSRDGVFGRESELVQRFAVTQGQVNKSREKCNVQPSEMHTPPLDECLAGAPAKNKNYQILVWGDSNADHYVPVLADVAADNNLTLRQMTMDGCQPVLFEGKNPYNEDCGIFNDAVRDIIEKHASLKLVVMAGAWTSVLTLEKHPPEDSKKFIPAVLEDSLARTVAWLEGRGVKVLLMGQIPIFDHWKDMTVCSSFALRRRDFSECVIRKDTTVAKHALSNRILERAAGYNTHLFLPLESLCPTDKCLVYDEKGLFYRDSFHLNLHGAAKLVPGLKGFWPQLGIGGN